MSRHEEEELLSIAKMGIDAESFIRTPLGRFLMKKADREISEATEELIAADPAEWRPNQELRNRIHVARMFKVWMSDAIEVGQHALRQLEEMEDRAQ